ncbi:gamma-glutamyltransferase [Nocardioides mangrovi]|uniref:Gamma-glutamyltransferase family protein n=1 Tax=Nocardioides mangrovi TaxID=2874580 RepID=A0ABS7UF12_9ACTN|nr:gamma-glutamyltransferase [Nocardioides mangrovi]MBZ5739352.1 gamma-glutamyltransferase family protein [Nocardioides mangrovi]
MPEVAIAAPHPAAVAAAEDAVAAGGNALDAALAAAVALTVVYPHQCSLGGDLIAVVQRPGEEVPRAVVSAGTLPAGLDLAALAGAPMPSQGTTPVTVPGVVAGWLALGDLGARLPLTRALTRGADLAASAPPVSAGLARAIVERADAVAQDPGLREVLGELVEGDPLRQPALAATLRALADDPRSFYDGEVGRALVAGLAALGGAHTTADLAAHRAEVVDALGAPYAGGSVWVAPPPSQGAVLLGVLGAADGTVPGAVAAAWLGMQVRDRELGDPRTGPVDVAALTGLALQPTAAAPPTGRALGDTVAVTAVDGTGLAVTLIQSVFQTFGAGILEPTTGIVLHNRGSAYSTDPAGPARLHPGARPPHTLCPAVVRTPERTVAVGCQGGRAQAWILSQVVPDLVAGADPGTVLGRPRWVVGARDLGHPFPVVVAEPGAEAALVAAPALGLATAAYDGLHDDAGHVQAAVLEHADGRLAVASDPRADGRGSITSPTSTESPGAPA